MTSKSEKAYIQASLLSDPPLRADGRSLLDYRTLHVSMSVAASANGSAQVNLGGTEILAACKLEVKEVENLEGADGGQIFCVVSCSPSAYPHLSSAAIDDIEHNLSHLLNSTLGHSSLRPGNLGILPGKKAWLLNIDCIVLADTGNIYDALFLAARAALCDTRVPVTRPVEYKTPQRDGGVGDAMDESGLDTRQSVQAADFELADYWSDGEALDGRDRWPVCVTMNLISSAHFLDATLQEDAAIPLRLLLIISCSKAQTSPMLHGTRLIGTGELAFAQLKSLVKDGQKYARDLVKSLDEKIQSEVTRRQAGSIQSRGLAASRVAT